MDENKKKPSLEDFSIPDRYARSAVFPLWQTSSRTSSSFTNEAIGNLLKDPYASYKKLRDVSNWMYANSSAYVNIIDYLAHIMSFDYIIASTETTGNKKTMLNRFMSAAKIVKDASIKELFPEMLKRTLVNGSTFWYDLSDKQNTIYVEIDSRLCQLALVDDDNIWRFYLDLALLTPDRYYEMPEEIRNAYDVWADGGKRKDKEKKILEGMSIELPANLYLVSKRGFALNAHLEKMKNDYPILTPMFKDFNTLEDNKTYLNETLKAEAIKIIHMTIPTDEEGFPLLSKEIIDAYHQSTSSRLPANVLAITDPFTVDAITLDKSQQNQTNLVQHSQEVISADSGVSKTIFSAETTNGLAFSTAKDLGKMLPYIYYFTNIVNYKIREQKMQIKFLPHSLKDRYDVHKTYTSDLPFGGSRMLWLATSGLEIYDAMKVLEFEQEIDIDSLLPVKASASQMNANDIGRPETPEGEKADSTVKVDETK